MHSDFPICSVISWGRAHFMLTRAFSIWPLNICICILFTPDCKKQANINLYKGPVMPNTKYIDMPESHQNPKNIVIQINAVESGYSSDIEKEPGAVITNWFSDQLCTGQLVFQLTDGRGLTHILNVISWFTISVWCLFRLSWQGTLFWFKNRSTEINVQNS